MLSAIRTLKTDDKYPPGHSLRDLTAYPAHVERAFAILAASGAGTPGDLENLAKDLGGRLVTGARFPDEPAGDRYMATSPELSDNTVVLAIVDLLRRRQNDAAVKDIFVALRRAHRQEGTSRG